MCVCVCLRERKKEREREKEKDNGTGKVVTYINSFMTVAPVIQKPVSHLIYKENQRTGFYMLGTSVMKELKTL